MLRFLQIQIKILSFLLPAAQVMAQAAGHLATFEVARIKSAVGFAWLPANIASSIQTSYDIRPPDIREPHPGQVAIRNASHVSLIAMAYGVPKMTVRAPKWARENLFDVDARHPAGSTTEQVRHMLRSLLEERFGLAAHFESDERSGYALLVAKGGSKLAPATSVPPAEQSELAGDEPKLAAALGKLAASGAVSAGNLPPGVSRRHFPRVNSQQIAAIIAGFIDAPVVDMTDLKGTYAVTIYSAGPDQPEYSILSTIDKLGLRLSKQRVHTNTLVVDRLEKLPTPN